MKALNVGCGKRFHPAWVNIDLVSHSPQVQSCDITKGLPFTDNTFDALYHSHVLEHLSKEDGKSLLQECFRVLQPGGVLRIAVPDLERSARAYLQALEEAIAGGEQARFRHTWMMLELTDQLARERKGGDMAPYLQKVPQSHRGFIEERIGEEARTIFKMASPEKTPKETKKKPFSLRRFLLRALVGERGERAYDIGKFRMSGEAHKQMYDRFSLAQAMQEAGFAQMRQMTAAQSAIPQWASYYLDTLEDGTVVKPDSLFMEAIKPSRV